MTSVFVGKDASSEFAEFVRMGLAMAMIILLLKCNGLYWVFITFEVIGNHYSEPRWPNES